MWHPTKLTECRSSTKTVFSLTIVQSEQIARKNFNFNKIISYFIFFFYFKYTQSSRAAALLLVVIQLLFIIHLARIGYYNTTAAAAVASEPDVDVFGTIYCFARTRVSPTWCSTYSFEYKVVLSKTIERRRLFFLLFFYSSALY